VAWLWPHQENMSYLWRLFKTLRDSERLQGFKDLKTPEDLSKFWFQSGKSFKDLSDTFMIYKDLSKMINYTFYFLM
jgi:hypothetical protein